MKDLTTGSISGHLFRLALPMAAGMAFQMLYYLIDLYFVAQLGDSAIAGVGAAGNVQFIVLSLTQVLGVGTMALIAQAVGRRDFDDANAVFNQSTLMAIACAVMLLVLGALGARRYMELVGADQATVDAGVEYLAWFLPGLALQFALVAMGSALRGTGIVKPTMVVQILTVVINAVLAPILILGWLTGAPMGVAGAGLASSISIGAGVVLLAWYFVRLEKVVHFDSTRMRMRLDIWRRILAIGVPPGAEFALMFVYIGIIYFVIRDFGSAAQAGFGIGMRVMQAIFLPAMAVAFAAAPLAGQNVGAMNYDRVRDTFSKAAIITSSIMIVLTLLCQWRPDVLVRIFTGEAAVIEVGAGYLRYISWNFVASGIVFAAAGMFQALGNTVPSLIASMTRIITFAIPAFWLSSRAGFELHHLWLLSVATVALQAVVSVWFYQQAVQKWWVRRVRAESRQAAT